MDHGRKPAGWEVGGGNAECCGLVESGVMNLSVWTSHSSRLLKVYRGLEEIVDKLKPDACAIEEVFYAVNPKVILKLGQVRGVALLVAESAALEIGEYAPRLVKQTVAGYGNADKCQVQEMVRVLLQLRAVPEPHDAADALAGAICHCHHAGVRERLLAAVARMELNPTVTAQGP